MVAPDNVTGFAAVPTAPVTPGTAQPPGLVEVLDLSNYAITAGIPVQGAFYVAESHNGNKGEIPLLVASDVAARGLDIPAVSHVFNFDVPHHADDYVHRIGLNGRAGRAGTAISIVAPLDYKSVAAIEKLIGQAIPRIDGGSESHADNPATPAKDETEHPRHSRARDGAAKEGGRENSRGGRKPRREREPRRSGGGRHSEPKTQAPAAAFSPAAAAQPSRPPSIGRHQAPHAATESSSEPADHSHLPAFLLRPVRARG